MLHLYNNTIGVDNMTDNELLQAVSDIMDKKLEPISDNMRILTSDVQILKSDVQTLKSDVQTLKSDVQTLGSNVQTLNSDMQTIKSKVTLIELTLENETNRNIQIIAENHLSLDRKLDEALKALQPNTMYHLKINHLDGEVSKIKSILNMA